MLEALLKEARGWLADCSFVGADRLSDCTAALLVAGHYEGGWPAFVRADPDMDGKEKEIYRAVLHSFGLSATLRLYPCPLPEDW